MVYSKRLLFRNGVIVKNVSDEKDYSVKLEYVGSKDYFTDLRVEQKVKPGGELKLELWSPGVIPFGMNPIRGNIVVKVFENGNLINMNTVKLS